MIIAHFKKPNRDPKNLLNSPKDALLMILVRAFANKETVNNDDEYNQI